MTDDLKKSADAAMQGMLANPELHFRDKEGLARQAVSYAEIIQEELQRRGYKNNGKGCYEKSRS